MELMARFTYAVTEHARLLATSVRNGRRIASNSARFQGTPTDTAYGHVPTTPEELYDIDRGVMLSRTEMTVRPNLTIADTMTLVKVDESAE